MRAQPVAVLLADAAPQGALRFVGDRRGCVMSMLSAASKGRAAAFDEDTCGCVGGKVGLGFEAFALGYIDRFLSTGTETIEGEYHRKSPEIARSFIETLPVVELQHPFVVFKPLNRLAEHETPEVVVFLATPDQLSGLATLASYDRPGRANVIFAAASGCQATVLLALDQARSAEPKCLLGMTDPAARRFMDPSVMSFAIPWRRFLEMEENVDESFLGRDAWAKLAERF
jgi:uncharacterized protein (DUF169 family)